VATTRIGSWLLVALTVAVADAAVAQSPVSRVNGYLTLASGYWKHGLSQNDGASLLAGVDYQHHGGLFVGGWAASVDFAQDFSPTEPREFEVNGYIGYHRRHGRWSWTATLGRYAYPGTAVSYDYDARSATIGFGDRVFYTATYSDEYYSRSRSALNQELSLAVPLRGDLELGGAIGHFAIDYGLSIDHWNFGVSKLVRRFALDLRYYDSDYESLGYLGNPDPRRYVFSVSYALRGKRPRG